MSTKVRVGRAAVCGSFLLTMAMTLAVPTAEQDIADFAEVRLTHDRWLASLVAQPSRFVVDPVLKATVKPVILNQDGLRLSGRDLNRKGIFRGFLFARTPQIARKLSQATTVNRAEKEDRPTKTVSKKEALAPVKALFDRSAMFKEPDEVVWPRVSLSLKKRRTSWSSPSKKSSNAKAVVTTEENAPLDLIPKAALAGIEAKAEEQARAEVDGTTTASIQDFALAQNSYARRVEGPQAVFEAILARPQGNARLPDAPKTTFETPLAVALDDAAPLVPHPRIKPEFVASLEPHKRKKKQHFWAAFRLPGSVHKKNQQRCLAAAIYFEARGEIEKGQAAVAQVVLNRVKAPAYPKTICGVVYQNKHWRNRCQFSFACDGIYDRIKDKKAWDRAVRIARDVSNGKIYLDKVADSTHYHATYVRPKWRKNMKVVDRIGVHIFYRTKNGGWS